MEANFDGGNIDKFSAICQYFTRQNFIILLMIFLPVATTTQGSSTYMKCQRNVTAFHHTGSSPSFDMIV